MKFLTIVFALTLSVSSFASGIDTMKHVLDQVEVTELERELAEKGMSLSKVADKYAENGVRPRCICESFELTFSGYKAGKVTTQVYSVSTTGFGRNMNVRIDKKR